MDNRLLRLWGKINGERFHPAFYHMMDVGHVARTLLRFGSPRWRMVLSSVFEGDHPLEDFIPYLISTHDLGKVSAPFQAQVKSERERVLNEGFPLSNWLGHHGIYHPQVGQVFIKQSPLDVPSQTRLVWGDVVGGHHGYYQSRTKVRLVSAKLQKHEDEFWPMARVSVDKALRDRFLLCEIPETTNVSLATVLLTGFAILSDWIGSTQVFFPCEPEIPLSKYLVVSESRSEQAISDIGLRAPVLSKKPAKFSSLFPGHSPRPLQKAIDDIPEGVLQEPSLTIIEAPTGEGKTEAAFTLAHRIAKVKGTDEVYIALPTTATSDQMFIRFQRYMLEGLELDAYTALAHGQANITERALRLGDMETFDAPSNWLSGRKRSLSAPFGVGTIDQAELAALNARHNSLRLIGLAGKTLIMDEVHAYDAYMSKVIQELLKWLSKVGTSVIILSATLTSDQKRAMMTAYGGEGELSESYPSLQVINRAQKSYACSPTPYQGDRGVVLERLSFTNQEAHKKAEWLLESVQDGGCACWIANVVSEAQDIYKALLDLETNGVDTILLHARFPLHQRKDIERETMEKLGPGNEERPKRLIVVGTQVLEQSLDIDVDVMVSEMAPVDLLLQRAGRLHRHERARPQAHLTPRFYINSEVHGEEPVFRLNALIYDPYLLYVTWEALRGRENLSLPNDYRTLIRQVYEGEIKLDEALSDLLERSEWRKERAETEAQIRLLPDCDPRWEFGYRSAKVAFKDTEGSSWNAAQTRLGRPTVNLIPLVDEGDKVRLWGTGFTFSKHDELSRDEQIRLISHHVRVSRQAVVKRIKQQDPYPAFESSFLLRRYAPLWLKEDSGKFGPLEVSMSRDLGVVYSKNS